MKRKLSFLSEMLGKQKNKLFLLVIVTMGYVLMNLLQPLLFSFIVDNVIDSQPITNPFYKFIADVLGGVSNIRANLWLGALVIVVIGIICAFMVFVRSRLNGYLSETISKNIRDTMYRHFMRLPYSYHVKSSTGDLIQRSTSDVDMVRRVFAGQISEFVYAIAMVGIASVILFNINVKLALIASSLFPFIFIFAAVFFKQVTKQFLLLEETEGVMTTAIQENLGAVRVVKAFNREKYEDEQFDQKNKKYTDQSMRVYKLLAVYWGASDVICLSSIALVVVSSIMMILTGEISIGDTLVFVSYTSMIVWPLRHVGRIIADLGKVSVAIDRLQDVINTPIEDQVSGIKPEINGNIEMNNVVFKYDDGVTNVLDGVDLSIKQGQTVAILGPTGSGKSSLAHILLGLYEYNEGSITIDGVELKDIQKGYLREKIAIVLQEPFLFSKSIENNIKLARPEATYEEIMEATRIASVHDVIDDFDQGYETMVGEKGVTLSGGQKQRMAIARTVINGSPILIFDDSLSAVDTETDANIRQALQEISKETTTIIITQRISSSEHADNIFVLEHGKITQEGNHQQLIKQEGLYKRVYEIQSNMEVGEING